MDCPICGRVTQPLFEKHGHTIRSCPACGHQCAKLSDAADHVDRLYGDSYFQGDSAGYADYLSEGRLLRNRGRWYARKLRRYLPPGRMLDVGAAAGFILQGFCDCGWQGLGLEPNARMAAFAHSQLGFKVETGTLETWASTERFDLVSMIQVVAHFYDLRRAFAVVEGATQPGGHLLIETWNRASWTAWLFGQHWHEYSPPSVLHWFTPRSLRRLVAQFGFEQIAIGRPRKRLLGSHAKLLLRPRLAELPLGFLATPLLGLIADDAELPYPAEDLFWALYRRRESV